MSYFSHLDIELRNVGYDVLALRHNTVTMFYYDYDIRTLIAVLPLPKFNPARLPA
jgi:hypothetical protein